MEPTRDDLIYTAGFFDGEGSIQILKYKKLTRAKAHQYFMQVAVGQNDGATLDWMQERFGGGVYLVRRDGSFYWKTSNYAGYVFIKKIAPFLKYKKEQADLAIKFYEERIIPSRRRPVSAIESALREEYLIEMKRLKRVFSKSLCLNQKERQQRLNESTPKGDVIVRST